MTLIPILRTLLPAPVVAFFDRLAAKLQPLLAGEPLRAITYGAVALVWIVSRALVITGILPIAPSVDAILIAVTGAISIIAAAIAEFARRWTYSPASVAAIVANPPTAAGPINAAAAAGVDPALIADELVSPSLPPTSSAVDPDAEGEGPVDETQKGAPLPPLEGEEPEPDEDLPEPEA